MDHQEQQNTVAEAVRVDTERKKEAGTAEPGWERRLLEQLAMESLREQRRRRRWSIFFKLLGFAYLAFFLFLIIDWEGGADAFMEGQKHTALINLEGVIEPDGRASAEKTIAALQSAFASKGAQGVILRVNSPGGSPVQSGMIYDEIRRLRAQNPNLPLYVVVEDICASGGYYVAAAADRIFVNKASIIGSIGVLMDGFGFTGTMDKLGIERRLLTAGENKGFLDPFSPQRERHREHAQVMLDDIHRQFIAAVREGRGKRLKEVPEMFSGLMWTGAKSVEIGLADAYGSVDSVAREVIKAEDILDYTLRENFAERFAKKLGAGATEAASRIFGLAPALR